MKANALAVLALVVALSGGALAATSLSAPSGQIHACVDHKGHLKVVKRGKKCGKRKTAVAWNVRGATGGRGAGGAPGAKGLPGLSAISFGKAGLKPRAAPTQLAGIDDLTVYGACADGGIALTVLPSGLQGMSYSGEVDTDDVPASSHGSGQTFTAGGDGVANIEVNVIARAGSRSTWTQLVLGAYRDAAKKQCSFWGFVLPSL